MAQHRFRRRPGAAGDPGVLRTREAGGSWKDSESNDGRDRHDRSGRDARRRRPPPRPRAVENCRENIAKQNENGQTGANTGDAQDPKSLPTAVTNCDHFWQNNGAIGNN
ncbi:MAG: hypothetical protein ACKOWF_13510 [Chloroflexota bacterium]